jgi:hypothetical protein
MVQRSRLTSLAPIALIALGACSIEHAPSGRPEGAAAPVDSAASAEVYAALRLYYARVTSRDWTALAVSFWPRAAITAIMGPPAGEAGPARMSTVTIEEAIRMAKRMKNCPVSLADEIVRANVVTYGPLADAWVTYRVRCGVARDSVTTHYGIDAVHLVKAGGDWRIAGLTYTNEIAGQPLGHP